MVSSRACMDFQTDGQQVLEQLRTELSRLDDLTFAVRSSTNIEDSASHSFAGQFQSFVNVKGSDRILQAIKEVWDSCETPVNSEYHSRVKGIPGKPACAVVIQEMVIPVLSGVSFSQNPVTSLNEIVVEAVEGLGEDLVQKGVRPHRWRIRGDFLLEGDDNFRWFPVIKTLAAATKKLRKSYGNHVDIEWAYDGKHLYYLQIRAITGVGKIPVYSSRMAREMLPGQIKPLVWSVNIPLVNGTWIDLLSEITGPLAVRPEDLAKPFYYRTYFNMASLGEIFNQFGLPVESLEFMLLSDQGGMPKMMPGVKAFRHSFRIIRFMHSKLFFEKTFLKRYNEQLDRYNEIRAAIRDKLSLQTWPELFNELFAEAKKTAYINIVVPLLMQIFNRRLKGKLKKYGADYDRIDFPSDFPFLVSLSPIHGMRKIWQLFEELPAEIKSHASSVSDLAGYPESAAFIKEFDEFMVKYGHLSESGNDFSVKKWEEDPDFVYKMILESGPRMQNQEMIRFEDLDIRGIGRPGLKRLYRRAGKYKVYREQVSSLYINGYGLFRTLFLNLGKEFVIRGIIDEPEDIFYLTREMVDRILAGHTDGAGFRQEVELRKKDMEETRDLLLPTVIYGDTAPILERGNFRNLKGIGVSPGFYKGRTRIVRGSADFSTIRRGEVLLIPFSDVSWTPALVQAGAIVSEAGGMLSHCSIIARELGIPTLVSVENACSLENGLSVTVDGSNGILSINEYE